jgi:hypothetical protein
MRPALAFLEQQVRPTLACIPLPAFPIVHSLTCTPYPILGNPGWVPQDWGRRMSQAGHGMAGSLHGRCVGQARLECPVGHAMGHAMGHGVGRMAAGHWAVHASLIVPQLEHGKESMVWLSKESMAWLGRSMLWHAHGGPAARGRMHGQVRVSGNAGWDGDAPGWDRERFPYLLLEHGHSPHLPQGILHALFTLNHGPVNPCYRASPSSPYRASPCFPYRASPWIPLRAMPCPPYPALPGLRGAPISSLERGLSSSVTFISHALRGAPGGPAWGPGRPGAGHEAPGPAPFA